MNKIIEPKETVVKEFRKFCKRKFRNREFSVAHAVNEFMKFRYDTDDSWTDIKNLTGYVKRRSEDGEFFKFTGRKQSRHTKMMSKHYRML